MQIYLGNWDACKWFLEDSSRLTLLSSKHCSHSDWVQLLSLNGIFMDDWILTSTRRWKMLCHFWMACHGNVNKFPRSANDEKLCAFYWPTCSIQWVNVVQVKSSHCELPTVNPPLLAVSDTVDREWNSASNRMGLGYCGCFDWFTAESWCRLCSGVGGSRWWWSWWHKIDSGGGRWWWWWYGVFSSHFFEVAVGGSIVPWSAELNWKATLLTLCECQVYLEWQLMLEIVKGERFFIRRWQL